MIAQIRAWALEEHNEDGTHRTAPAITNHVPTGAMMEWPTATAPANWLLCNGDQVSRVTYNPLFLLIGTTFGAGDGSTTFNLPDFRGRFALGKSVSGTGSVLGASGGTIDHSHTGGAVSGSTANATATISGVTGATQPSISGSTGSVTAGLSGSTSAEASHTHSIDPPDTDLTKSQVDVDRNADGIMVDVVSVAVIPHTDIASFISGAGSSHLHGAGTLLVDNHAHPVGTLAVGSHDHPKGTLAVDNHLHGAGTLAVGVSGSANPPFLVVNKIIKT